MEESALMVEVLELRFEVPQTPKSVVRCIQRLRPVLNPDQRCTGLMVIFQESRDLDQDLTYM